MIHGAATWLVAVALYGGPCIAAMILSRWATGRAARGLLLSAGIAMLALNAAAVGGAALFDAACSGNMPYGYEDCATDWLQAIRRPAAAFILVWLFVGAVVIGGLLLLAAAIAEVRARRRGA